MRKIKDFSALIAASLICVCIVGGSVLAEDGEYNRGSRITSKGVIEYANNTVVIDSSDFTYLAEEIDELERAYKSTTMEALNQIGTFYASADGDISHDYDNNNVSSDMAAELSFGDLYQGIIKSQSVDHLDNVQPATADNLTAGTAAWVDGSILIGNGADNTAYYDMGKQSTDLSLTSTQRVTIRQFPGGDYPVNISLKKGKAIVIVLASDNPGFGVFGDVSNVTCAGSSYGWQRDEQTYGVSDQSSVMSSRLRISNVIDVPYDTTATVTISHNNGGAVVDCFYVVMAVNMQ